MNPKKLAFYLWLLLIAGGITAYFLYPDEINILFLELRGKAEAGLLKYTNENFKNICVILALESETENLITTGTRLDFRAGRINIKHLW